MTGRAPLTGLRRGTTLALLALFVAVGAGACAKRVETPVPAGAPRFPAFLFPAPPEALLSHPAAAKHEAGWQWLQAGDFGAAERQFQAALKESAAAFYPAEAGLGYVAYAQKDYEEAIEHFDRAVAADGAYVPALVGRGEAQLALGQNEPALASFEAAVAVDSQLAAVRSRIEVLRFRGLQDHVSRAREAAEARRFAEARTAYQQAIAASPQSPFLYRELAIVEGQEGRDDDALANATRAVELDPADARALVLIADLQERRGDFTKALDALTDAVALEPSDAIDERIEALRAKSAFAAMPDEYRMIESSPTVTRAQLAALLGVRLDDLLKRTRRRSTVVITDTRGSWAAPWILAVTRAGIMEVYPNHTFQPHALVRRSDLAAGASSTLSLIAAENPRLAAAWRNPRRRFPDVPAGHLNYAAVSLAVEAGVMAPLGDGSFQLTRPVTGAEVMAAVATLEQLAQRSR